MSVTAMKTPGVYIQELDAFGNAVVPVPTAIPAFIGYTEQTNYNGKDLVNKAVRITSFAEFSAIFGSKPPQIQFGIAPKTTVAKTTAATPTAADSSKKKSTDAAKSTTPVADTENVTPADFFIGTTGYILTNTTVNYRLYSAIRFFYENGGGTCYIVSTGNYDYTMTGLTTTTPFTDALTVLEKETEPTMVIIPDAIELVDSTETELAKKYALCYTLQGELINHCGVLSNRIALIDIPGGYSEPLVGTTSVEGFRNAVEPTLAKFNSYAAAYYPWLHTTVNQATDISYKNIAAASYTTIKTMLNAEFPNVMDPKTKNSVPNPISKYITALFAAKPAADGITPDKADSVLKNLSATYKLLFKHLLEKLNLMPPSAAMAGIYTTVDNNEGVWVAPANVGVQSVVAPAIKIDLKTQEDLNMPLDGKSVCAIRSFPGKGVLVWGARTLDGNSNDWRYINVRRTLIYIEQSVKEAASAFVFAPNDANTWVSVKSMISSFLLGLWNQGGLVGPKPADAFTVTVGLGSTMTSDDILNGRMIVAVKVAVSHPAEFIEITFQQEMQKA